MMKSKIAQIIGFTLTAALAFTGCPGDNSGPEPGPVAQVAVTFDLDYPGAAAIPDVTVDSGSAAGYQWPGDPGRLGYTFDGWFAGAEKYDAQTAISNDVTVKASWTRVASVLEDQPSGSDLAALFDTSGGFPANLSNSWKIWGHRNPLITQGFSADPTTMIYNGRVYLFASNDSLEYNASGAPEPRTFGQGIQGVRVISSADLSNWTDHGVIRPGGIPASTNPLIPEEDLPRITPFDTRSWAPSATWKMVDGKPKFFLYFANSGDGIGVITADSPTGPWTSPLNKLLIDRDTPTCSSEEVDYLFDPGIFIDEDGKAYLFFGGGQAGRPGYTNADWGYARRVRLNDDMVSLDGNPEQWVVPYLFEASDMFKLNGVYYFSYCCLTSVTGNTFGLESSEIAYMMSSDHPMGTFRPQPKGVLKMASRPTQLSSSDDNNHQTIFVFKDTVYIAYHAAKVAEAMGTGKHRSSFIDKVTLNNRAELEPVTMTRKGVDQTGYLNPYAANEAETIAVMGGIYTRAESGASNGMVVTSIDTGDWVGVYGVDFGSAGAKKFTARIRTPETADYTGAIELRLDPSGAGVTGDTGNVTPSTTTRITGGEVIGRVQIKAKAGEAGKYTTAEIDLDKTVTGVHDLVFVFYSSLGVRPETVTRDSPHKNAFEFDQWQFFSE